MKHKFVLLQIIACFFSVFAYSESFNNKGNEFISGDTDFFDSGNSFINDGNEFISKENDFLGKNASIYNSASAVVDSDTASIGTYDIVVSKTNDDSYETVYASVYQDTEEDSYENGYGKWLEIVTTVNPRGRHDFALYVSDWQWSGQNEDFFAYSANRTKREWQAERCYDAALAKFGAGTAIVSTVWVLSWTVPGGQVVSAAILVVAKATTIGALSGGMLGGVTAAGMAYLQGKRGDELLYATINGTADGFLIGAVTGLMEGSFSAAKKFSDAFAFGDKIYSKIGLAFDKNGNIIGNWYDSKGYLYITDNHGRITRYAGNLRLEDGVRNRIAQQSVGGAYRLSGDDGGHLIGRIFGGSGDIDNLVPMKGTLNRGEYKRLENLWKDALTHGNEVIVDGTCIYNGESTRPVKFIINYTIDGIKNRAVLLN